MELIIIMSLLAAIPTKLAYDKGRNPWLWFVYSFFFWIIALVHSLFIKPNANAVGYKSCKNCLSVVPELAGKCKHCGSYL